MSADLESQRSFVSTLVKMVGSFTKVNPLDWKETLDCLKAIEEKTAAFKLTAAEIQQLKNVAEPLLKEWKAQPTALLQLQTWISKAFVQKELPEQSTGG